MPGAVLVSTRAWPEDEWATAVDELRTRGILDRGEPLALTDLGRAQREWIEDTTDAAAVAAYAPLGDDGCARLRELTRPWSRAVIDAGGLTTDPD